MVKKEKRMMDWERGRANKQHISGRMFLNPSLTSHQKRKNKEKRINLQSCKYMQKGTTVFEKGVFKKKETWQKRVYVFFWTKNEHRDKRFVICVWKIQRQRKQNNTHKEEEKEQQKKKREHSKKEKNKRFQPTQEMKKWQRNQKQSKNNICKRYMKR